MKDDIQTEIKNLEDELLNLKQKYNGLANVAGYMYQTEVEDGSWDWPNYEANFYKITFKEGKGDLIVSFNSGIADPVPLKIEDNVQYIQVMRGGTLYIISSWEVDKFEKIVL